jgi:C4-dicarboxylate transporter DctM subunit
VPVLFTFLIVLGGIYMGVWSVIEAASTGAILAVIFSIVYRRLNWVRLRSSLYTTFRICSMVFTIVISATFLNYFVFVSKFDEMLVSFVNLLDLPGWAVIIAILLILSAMGCIFDMMALLLLSIPVFLPLAASVGYSPVWFGIILIIAAELALITPPVGLNLFILKDLAPKGTTTMDVAKGALPLVSVVWLLFILLTAFPQIALWLPSVMRHS